MTTLREVQTSFREAVMRGGTPDWIAPGGLPAERRLAIYRNNCFLGLTEALRDGFPVINRLIGTDCFDGVARRFVAASPPQSGCLLDYGGDFAEWLATDPATLGLPYLADIARLEWFWHLAFHAASEPAWTLAELAGLPPEARTALRWRLQPSAALLDSVWPLARIFELNQTDQPEPVTLSLDREAAGPLLVFQSAGEVLAAPLGRGEFALLTQLVSDGDLDGALVAGLSAEPEFDFAGALARLFDLGVFAPPEPASL